ncbi:hypothetical protein [Kitasatospora sp. NPDC088783]|uniref:hypothetical protein n=1 Tax=Kitasatospora sp. NPDC088783 TaxID=3364077 RepID=UPI00382E426C
MGLFTPARRRQETARRQRADRRNDARTVFEHAARMAGLDLLLRPHTWQHLVARHHADSALAAVVPAPAGEGRVRVRLAGPLLAELLAGLFEDMESQAHEPDAEAARAVAATLYPRLAAIVRPLGFGALPADPAQVGEAEVDTPWTAGT